MLSAVNTIIEIDMSVIVTFVSVAVLYYFEIPLKPAYIVYALAFYTRLNGTLGYFLSKAIRNGASTLVSLKRVEVNSCSFHNWDLKLKTLGPNNCHKMALKIIFMNKGCLK